MSDSAVSTKVTQIVDLFTQLTVMELLQLQEALEAKGIKPAAAVAVAAGGGAAAAAPAEEQSTFTVVLKDGGAKKIQVIKEIRTITSLGLKEAKDLVEGAPKTVKEGVDKAEAEKIKKVLEDAGGTVELK